MRSERQVLVGRACARLALLAACAGLPLQSGCEGPGIALGPVAVGPMDVFATEVEPIIETRCAQGGCHGRSERPFALFAPGAHRLDPDRRHLAEPLDEIEIVINARRLAALADPTVPERSLALRKPLAIEAGGVYHGGGDVFVDRSDAGYRSLLRWLTACAPTPAGGV